MRLRDQGDDREPEPAAPLTPRVVGAAEPVERALEKAIRKTGSGIGNVQLHDVVPLHGEEIDRAGAVIERVLDEVRERLPDSRRVG